MPRIQTLARVIRSLNIRKTSNKTKSTKSNRSVPVLIATVAVLAAVVFSVSVESRRAGWLKKAEPSTRRQPASRKWQRIPRPTQP